MFVWMVCLSNLELMPWEASVGPPSVSVRGAYRGVDELDVRHDVRREEGAEKRGEERELDGRHPESRGWKCGGRGGKRERDLPVRELDVAGLMGEGKRKNKSLASWMIDNWARARLMLALSYARLQPTRTAFHRALAHSGRGANSLADSLSLANPSLVLSRVNSNAATHYTTVGTTEGSLEGFQLVPCQGDPHPLGPARLRRVLDMALGLDHALAHHAMVHKLAQ